MDPVTLFPLEVWRLICHILPLDDLVTLGQVNRRWRQFFRDPTMWIEVTLEVGVDPVHVKNSIEVTSEDDSSELEDVDDDDGADSSEDYQSEGDYSEDDLGGSDNSEDGDGESDISEDGRGGSDIGEDSQGEGDNSEDDHGEGNYSKDDNGEGDNKGDEQSGGNLNESDKSHSASGASDSSKDKLSECSTSGEAQRILKLANDALSVEGGEEDPEVKENIHPHPRAPYEGPSCLEKETDSSVESALAGHSQDAMDVEEAVGSHESEVETKTGELSGKDVNEKPTSDTRCLGSIRTACRVLRAAPCLKMIVLRGWRVHTKTMEALMGTKAQVAGLRFTTFVAEPEDAKKVISKFRLHLKELYTREASRQLLHLLCSLTLPLLQAFSLDSIADFPLGSDQYMRKCWITPSRPALRPDSLVGFITAHCSTLRYLTMGNMWCWTIYSDKIMAAVAACRTLTHLSVFCSEFLRIRAVTTLPSLKHLTLRLMVHQAAEVDHQLCLELLPPSLEHLVLQLILVDFGKEVVDFLIRQAPRLPNLRSLLLEVMFETPDLAEHLQRFRAAFPGVTVRIEVRIDVKTGKLNPSVCSPAVPCTVTPSSIDWSK